MGRSVVGVGILAAALVGCAPKDIFYKVSIVTTSCDSSQDPFEGVQYLRLRVVGDGIATPLEATAVKDAAARELKVPAIPAGTNRVIEVRGYDGDPAAGGRVVSMGRTSAFDVPDVVPDSLAGAAIEKFIFLRRVNAFTPPSSAAQPSQCQRMRVARAGHSATLLKNGKVFVAGGFNFKPGLPEKLSLSETEVFDPATGAFGQARDLSITSGTVKLPKAFHSATRLPSGQVMLWGGEAYAQGANNVVSPNAVVLIYDPDKDDYGAVRSRANPPSIIRTQHSAALDMNGKVLIAGGLTRTSSGLLPADKVEWFDPTTLEYKVVDGVTLPRLNAGIAALKQGEFVVVAGGSDGAALKTDVAFFRFDGTEFRQQALANPPRLVDPGRRAAGVATLRDGNDMLLLGGYTDPTGVRPVASSEIVTTSSATVAQGPSVGSRGDICAVTMADGTVLAIGGRTTDTAGGPSHSDGTSVLIKADSGGGTNAVGGPTLGTGRFAHSCTLLSDGTVLVLGGINEATNGTQEVLQDAWIFQPAPVD